MFYIQIEKLYFLFYLETSRFLNYFNVLKLFIQSCRRERIILGILCNFPYVCIVRNAGHFLSIYFHGMCLEETHVTMISSFYKDIQQAKSDLRLSVLAKRKITLRRDIFACNIIIIHTVQAMFSGKIFHKLIYKLVSNFYRGCVE